MNKPPREPIKLFAEPLRPGERGLLARALDKAGIAVGDVEAPGTRFWRFEMPEGTPVGYGGLEVHNKEALLRAVLTLPPAQGRGIGRAIAAALETEAFVAGCRHLWVAPGTSAPFFEPLGYRPGDASKLPDAVRERLASPPARQDGSGVALLVKALR